MPIIKQMKIEVLEASIKNYQMVGNYNFQPEINGTTSHLNDNNYSLTLDFVVKNTLNNPFPIDIKVKLIGYFEFGDEKEEVAIKFLEREGIQIVYPYLRSLITNMTSAALLKPLVLPIIDANDFKFTELKKE